MADLSWKQTLFISLLTAGITLLGTYCLQVHQDERADRARLLDGAQTSAQDTKRLLDNGYNALAKLLKGMDQKGWDDFSKGPLDEYMEFRRGWRQQLIAEHFKLSRYFGKDMANDLIHIDEIDTRPTDNLSSPNPCSRPAKYQHSDIEKLAAEIECHARFMTVKQDAVNGRLDAQQTDELVEALNSKMDLMNETKKLLRQYDKASVSYLRKLDTRLTKLGVSTVTAL